MVKMVKPEKLCFWFFCIAVVCLLGKEFKSLRKTNINRTSYVMWIIGEIISFEIDLNHDFDPSLKMHSKNIY